MAKWGDYNETTYHNWFKKDLNLIEFNKQLIDTHGSGDHFVIFDPSYISKSGKKTPSIGNFWSGGAGAVKRGIEMSSLGVGDLEQHTAYHLSASLTPNPKELKREGKSVMEHYVSEIKMNEQLIKDLGNIVAADGYFGVDTFIRPVTEMGIDVVSCLKSNACLFYMPKPVEGKRPQGRPRKKDGKVDWNNVDDSRLPIVKQDEKKIVRTGIVYVKSMKRYVLLVAVDYLKEDGSLQKRKLYFSTRLDLNFERLLDYYKCRFQIEFLFRDAKQFTGLMNCQSTNEQKLLNHLNLALTAVSVAKAEHWEQEQPFSLADIKNYYYNLKMVELISDALGLDSNAIKNNPNIINILFSMNYDDAAA